MPDGTQVGVQINNAKGSIQYLTIDHLQYLISGDTQYLIWLTNITKTDHLIQT